MCVWVCVFVCTGGWVGGLGVYHIQRLTNLLFSQDLYKKKQRRLAVDNSVLCFYFGPNPTSFSFFGLC